ncbi:MAG: hypothetical protein J6Y28_08645 [Acholeplasmatales bacterium]|nr:hypothetical protein [Acholeplasmatales bacterium]
MTKKQKYEAITNDEEKYLFLHYEILTAFDNIIKYTAELATVACKLHNEKNNTNYDVETFCKQRVEEDMFSITNIINFAAKTILNEKLSFDRKYNE